MYSTNMCVIMRLHNPSPDNYNKLARRVSHIVLGLVEIICPELVIVLTLKHDLGRSIALSYHLPEANLRTIACHPVAPDRSFLVPNLFLNVSERAEQAQAKYRSNDLLELRRCGRPFRQCLKILEQV